MFWWILPLATHVNKSVNKNSLNLKYSSKMKTTTKSPIHCSTFKKILLEKLILEKVIFATLFFFIHSLDGVQMDPNQWKRKRKNLSLANPSLSTFSTYDWGLSCFCCFVFSILWMNSNGNVSIFITWNEAAWRRTNLFLAFSLFLLYPDYFFSHA